MSDNYVKKWSSILLNWVNCLDIFKEDIKDIAELQDGFCLYSIISYQRSNGDEELCGDQLAAKAAVDTFLKGQFPHYDSPDDGELDTIMKCSLLLHSICVDPNDNKLKKIMCKNLSNRDQKAIFIFSKSMMKHRPITYEEIKNSIYSNPGCPRRLAACLGCYRPPGQMLEVVTHHQMALQHINYTALMIAMKIGSTEGNDDSTALNTSAMLTPPGVRAFQQRETDLRRMRTALDSERFDRCYLQDELKRVQELADKLGVENEFLKKQLSRPLQLNQDDQDKENLPNNNPHTATELKAAEKQITLLRKEKDDMSDRIQDQREQIEAIQKKLEAALSAVSDRGLALEEAEMRAMVAENAAQAERRNAASLQEMLMEFQAMIRSRDPANISVEVDEVDLSRQLPSQSGCNYSFTSSCSTEDLASAVIEVQLRELQAKYAKLEEELTNKDNTIRNFQTDIAYNKKQLSSLESCLKDKETNIFDLKHCIEEMTIKEEESIKKHTIDLETVKLELHNVSLEFQNKLNSQDREVNKYRDENKQLNAKIREFSSKIKELKQSIAEKDKKNQEYVKVSTSLQGKVTILIEENEKVRNEFQQEKSAIKEQVNILKHEKDLIGKRMIDIDSRNEMLMQRVEKIQFVMEEKIVSLNEEKENVVASITDKYEHQILLLENERESTVHELKDEIENTKCHYEEAVSNLKEVHSKTVTSLTASLVEKDQERTKVENDLNSLIKELEESKQEELLNLTTIKNYEIASMKESLESEILELEKEKSVIISKLHEEIEVTRGCYKKELCKKNEENLETVNSLEAKLLEKDKKLSNLEVDIQTLEKQLNEIVQNNIEMEHLINEQEGKIQSSELQILTLEDDKEITLAKLQNEIKENQNKFENELQMLRNEKIEIVSSLALERKKLVEVETTMLALEKQLQEVFQKQNEDFDLINSQQNDIAVLKENFDQQISAVENEKEISIAKLQNEIKDIKQNYEDQLQRVEKNQLVTVEKLQKLNLEKSNLMTSVTEKYEHQILLLKNDSESIVCKLQEDIKNSKYHYEEAVSNLNEVLSETVTSLTASLVAKDQERTKLESDLNSLIKELEESKQEELLNLTTIKNYEIASVKESLESKILELEKEKTVIISKLNNEIEANRDCYKKELSKRNEENLKTVNFLEAELLEKDRKLSNLGVDLQTLDERFNEIVQNNIELEHLINEQEGKIQSSELQILTLEDDKEITVAKLQNEVKENQNKFENELQMLRKEKIETVSSLALEREERSEVETKMLALERQLQEVFQKQNEDLDLINRQQNEIAVLKENFDQQIAAVENEKEISIAKLQNEIKDITQNYEEQLQRVEKNQLVTVEKLQKLNLEKSNLITSVTEKYEHQILLLKNDRESIVCKLQEDIKNAKYDYEEAVCNLTELHSEKVTSLTTSLIEKDKQRTKLENDYKTVLKDLEEAKEALRYSNTSNDNEIATVRDRLECEILELEKEKELIISKLNIEIKVNSDLYEKELFKQNEEHTDTVNSLRNELLQKDEERAALEIDIKTLEEQLKQIVQSNKQLEGLISEQNNKLQSSQMQILALEDEKNITVTKLQNEIDGNNNKFENDLKMLRTGKVEAVNSLTNDLLKKNEICSKLQTNIVALEKQLQEVLQRKDEELQILTNKQQNEIALLKQSFEQQISALKYEHEASVSKIQNEIKNNTEEYEKQLQKLKKDNLEEVNSYSEEILEINKLQSQLQKNILELRKQLEEVVQHKEIEIQNLTKSKDNEIKLLKDGFENEKRNIITKLQNEKKYELRKLQEENAEALNNLQKKDELRLKLENDIKSLRNELDASIQRGYEELQNLTEKKKDEIASVTDSFSELEKEKKEIILKLQKENAELTSELRKVIQSKVEEIASIQDNYEQQILELEQDNKDEVSELDVELNELKTTYTEAVLSNARIVNSLKNELLTVNEGRSRFEANTQALKESISCLNKELLEKDKLRFELESNVINLREVVVLKEEDIQKLTKKNQDMENAVSRLEEEKRVLALEYENTVKLLSEDKNEETSHLANSVQVLELEKAKTKEFEKKNQMLEGDIMSLKEKIYNLEELSKSLTIHNKMISEECDSFRDKVSEKEGIITYLEAKTSGLSTANTDLEKNVDTLIAKLNDFDKISNKFETMQNESELRRLKWLQEKLVLETALNTVRQEKESKENKLEVIIYEKDKRISEIEKRSQSANLRIKELETMVDKLTDQMESSSARFNSLAKQKDAAIKKLQGRIPNDVDQRVMEVREEYEDKLNRMKDKMLEMLRREKANHQKDMKKQTERADRLEIKLANITGELWKTGEKMLNMQHDYDWMRKKNVDGKLTLPKGRPERASSAADLHMLPLDKKRDKDIDSISLHSAPPHRSDMNVMHMSDEEGEVFDNAHLAEMQMTPVRNVRGQPPASFNDWKRLSELQRRNSLCPPHLRSSYPAETQFHKPEKFKEDELKFVSNVTPLKPLVERKLPKVVLPVAQAGPTERRKEAGAGTVYRRPGPPTPSKKGGRLSATSLELRAVSSLDSEQSGSNVGRKSSTPSRLRALFMGSNTTQESGTSTPKSRRFSIFKKTS